MGTGATEARSLPATLAARTTSLEPFDVLGILVGRDDGLCQETTWHEGTAEGIAMHALALGEPLRNQRHPKLPENSVLQRACRPRANDVCARCVGETPKPMRLRGRHQISVELRYLGDMTVSATNADVDTVVRRSLARGPRYPEADTVFLKLGK